MGGPINTFSVGFHEETYDETSYARLVSKQYGTHHHEIKLTNEEFADLLPKMIWYNDEPLNFANSIQIYAISKLARESVTVVLTGEGAAQGQAKMPTEARVVEAIQAFNSLARTPVPPQGQEGPGHHEQHDR